MFATRSLLRDLLIEIDIDAVCRLGTGHTRYFAPDPREMSQIIVQDVRPPRASSKSHADPRVV